MNDTLSHTISGVTSSSNQYGKDYISEFKRVINLASHISGNLLEWGSGYTTRILAEYGANVGCNLLLTIDENKNYLTDVIEPLKEYPFIRGEVLGVTGPCLNDRDQGLNYSSFPLSLGEKFDIIFIDGRRRMECAFVASLVSHRDSLIILHDYRRARYQHVEAMFNVIESGAQFKVMKVR